MFSHSFNYLFSDGNRSHDQSNNKGHVLGISDALHNIPNYKHIWSSCHHLITLIKFRIFDKEHTPSIISFRKKKYAGYMAFRHIVCSNSNVRDSCFPQKDGTLFGTLLQPKQLFKGFAQLNIPLCFKTRSNLQSINVPTSKLILQI